jgi:hypothetical protein
LPTSQGKEFRGCPRTPIVFKGVAADVWRKHVSNTVSAEHNAASAQFSHAKEHVRKTTTEAQDGWQTNNSSRYRRTFVSPLSKLFLKVCTRCTKMAWCAHHWQKTTRTLAVVKSTTFLVVRSLLFPTSNLFTFSHAYRSISCSHCFTLLNDS